MFEKIQKYQKHLMLGRLKDVRVLGQIAFGVLVLLVSWSGIKIIQTNYGLEKRIAKLQQENELQELENANLKLRNQYYNTPQFLELAARRQFGLAMPGEKLIIVPKQVALAHVADIPAPVIEKPAEPEDLADKPRYQKNFEAWMNFLLHRESGE